MRVFSNIYSQIISPENLFAAWEAFRSDKPNKPDVLDFESNLEANLFKLHRDLRSKAYRHGPYASFYIHDPKQRHIHKASVRDRVLHHAIYNILNPIFEPTFIANSFSCRIGKGTHKGVETVEQMVRSITRNGTRIGYVLKCDIQKFFFRIDHSLLLTILKRRLQDHDTVWLLQEVIGSLPATDAKSEVGKGLPISNLTSQLFANVYMNEFDQFMKHELRVKNYARYTDDFLIVAEDPEGLEFLLPSIRSFLQEYLALKLHPKKTSIRKIGQGVDFLGYTVFPDYTLLRTKTKQRIFRKLHQRVSEFQLGKINMLQLEQSLQSYRGVLSHANTHELQEEIENQVWFWQQDFGYK